MGMWREHLSRLAANLQSAFATGVACAAALFCTGYVLWAGISLFHGAFATLASWGPRAFKTVTLAGAPVTYFLGFALAAYIITVIGAWARHRSGTWILRQVDRTLERLPLLRDVFATTKQLVGAYTAEENQTFQTVVAFQNPSTGHWSIGLAARDVNAEVHNPQRDSLYPVFVPSTPNPLSGMLLFVPTAALRPLDISVKTGLHMIAAMGGVTPHRQEVVA